MKLLVTCASLFLASLWLPPCAFAQGGTPEQMMLLNVRVTDEAGHAVADARREDFSVVEDGVPQTISFFSKAEVPLSYGLLIDNSGSLRVAMDKIDGAGKTIVGSNKPRETGGRVFFANSTADLRGIAEELTSDLRTQYLVGYTPAGGPRKDSFHRVQATVADAQGGGKRTAFTRVGYVAGPRPNR